MPMLLRASAPGPVTKTSGRWPKDGRRRRHEHGAQAGAGGLAQRQELALALLLQRVRELDDEDAVLGDQAHECDQPDLRVDVDRRLVEIREQQRTADRERHRTEQHDERIAEAAELGCEHQVDEQDRKSERRHQRRRFVADLA
jgi:hypothetical protein